MKSQWIQNVSRILLVGPRSSGTPTGVSVAFEMLVGSIQSQAGLTSRVVNMSARGQLSQTGAFSFSRAFYVLCQFFSVLRYSIRSDLAYLVISSSRLGFIKDCLVIWTCWLTRCPVVVHLHGGGYEGFYSSRKSLGRWLIRLTLNRVHRIVVLGNTLRRQFSFVDGPEIVVVENGVSAADGVALNRLKTPPQPGQPWEFLFLSNLMMTKRYLETAQAVASLLDKGHAVRLHLCGNFVHSAAEGAAELSEENRKAFFKLLGRANLAGKVIYHGNADAPLKNEMLSRCHCLVLPTTYPGEGQPLCILEAMAHGLPVVATNHAGISEQVADGTTGVLLRSGSVDEIRMGLMRMVESSTMDFARMSQASIERFQRSFTQEAHLNKLHDVLYVPRQASVRVGKRKAA